MKLRVLLLAVWCLAWLPAASCIPQVLDALAGVAKGAQWVGSLVEVADASQQQYFQVNPDPETQQKVAIALLRARQALAVLNEATLSAKDAKDGKIAEARAEAVAAYKDLEELIAPLITHPHMMARPGHPHFAMPAPSKVSAALGE